MVRMDRVPRDPSLALQTPRRRLYRPTGPPAHHDHPEDRLGLELTRPRSGVSVTRLKWRSTSPDETVRSVGVSLAGTLLGGIAPFRQKAHLVRANSKEQLSWA